MENKLHFTQVKKIRLYEEIAEQIKKTIFDGDLKPGDSLPSERELGRMFGVGRPAVREALRTLSVMGLIEVNAGLRGSVVKEVDITHYMDTLQKQLAWMIQVDEQTMKEMWEVRNSLERGIAHSVACNATEEDFAILDNLIKEMDACGDDIFEYFPVAVEFHRQLALCTKNKVYYIIWQFLHDALLKGYMPILDKLFPEGPDKLREPNRALLKAIKSRDVKAIDRMMEIHAQEEKFFEKVEGGVTSE
jgi:GntR family transcriptional repressor for pyruvate dehydrogenase complex